MLFCLTDLYDCVCSPDLLDPHLYVLSEPPLESLVPINMKKSAQKGANKHDADINKFLHTSAQKVDKIYAAIMTATMATRAQAILDICITSLAQCEASTALYEENNVKAQALNQ